MPDTLDPAQEAAEALNAIGRKVVPIADDYSLWRVEGEGHPLTDWDLIVLAFRLGVMDAPRRTQ